MRRHETEERASSSTRRPALLCTPPLVLEYSFIKLRRWLPARHTRSLANLMPATETLLAAVAAADTDAAGGLISL